MAPGKQVRFCIFLLMPRVQERHHQQKNLSFERKGHYKERNPLLHHGPSGLQEPFCGKEAGPEWQVSPLMTPGIFHISPAVHHAREVCLMPFQWWPGPRQFRRMWCEQEACLGPRTFIFPLGGSGREMVSGPCPEAGGWSPVGWCPERLFP